MVLVSPCRAPSHEGMIPVVRGSRLLRFTRCIIRVRDTQDEWLLYSLFAAWFYVLLKFHKTENRRIVNVVHLIDVDVASEGKSRMLRTFRRCKSETSFVRLSDAACPFLLALSRVYLSREREREGSRIDKKKEG